MRAAVWHGGKDVRIEDVPKPKVKTDEVLVRVKAVGICGSDLHAYEGVSERRRPPLIMGHEFSGEVAEAGTDVKDLGICDRVVVDPFTRCGKCEQCLGGRDNLCRKICLIGLHTNGAFAEYVSAPARNCYRMPADMSFEEGSMVEPFSVALRAINRTPVKLGDTVAVIGAGIIGLMLLQAAKAAGAGKTFITDVLDYRLDFGRKLGADITVNSKVEDPVATIREATSGLGVDVTLEAVGVEATVQHAMRIARTGGKVTIAGMLSKAMMLDVLDAVVRELDIRGSYAYASHDFRRAFSYIKEKRIDVKPLVTDVLPLYEAKRGFELLHEKKAGVLKVLLVPESP